MTGGEMVLVVEGGAVVIDREQCIGSGMCIVYAPNTFTHDDDAKVAFVDPSDDPADVIRTAIEACPTGALRLVEHTDGPDIAT